MGSRDTALQCHNAQRKGNTSPHPIPLPQPSYCFCVYKTREGADKAMTLLEGREVKDFPGRRVNVVPSIVKNKLYVGGMPRDITREELEALLHTEVVGKWKVECGPCLDRAHPCISLGISTQRSWVSGMVGGKQQAVHEACASMQKPRE